MALKSAEVRRRKRDEAQAENKILAAAEAELAFADPTDVSAMVLKGLIQEARTSSSATARVAAYRALAEAFPMRDRQREREQEAERAGPLELAHGGRVTSIADVIDLADELGPKFGINIWARDARGMTQREAARKETDAVNKMATALYTRVIALRQSEAWRNLGYASWQAFAEAELDASPSLAGRGTEGARADRSLARKTGPAGVGDSHSESADGDAGEDAGDAGGLAKFRRAVWRAFS
jgi:hypothetical protein